jgi:hypothetical protein
MKPAEGLPAPGATLAPPVGPSASPGSPSAAEASSGSGSTANEGPAPPQTSNPAKPPRADDLVDALPPRAPQGAVDLPPGTVGSPYRQELPAFQDPGDNGLSLSAAGLPEGMTFNDLGDGRGAIEGAPIRAGTATVQIAATNHNGRTAHMLASIAIADRPAEEQPYHPAAPIIPPARPQGKEPGTTAPPSAAPGQSKNTASTEPPVPSEKVAVVAATAGVDFVSNLPRFNVGANSAGIMLRAEPDAPPGLVFADLGFGSSRLSGTPLALGSYTFDVVATDPAGQSGRMTVRLLVSSASGP